jgi:UDP-N-acetylglucosamine 4,6-dehydratase
VQHAFEQAQPRRPLHPQGPGVRPCADLALGRGDGGRASRPKLKVIGTRHGEKLYETLATREELARSEDQGEFFRISVDARELNYDQYFEEGDQEESTLEDYHSHNTERLDVDQVVDLLNSMPAFQALLRAD